MNNKYRILEKGEVIRKGDEVEISNSWKDPAKWVDAAEHTLGTTAPDPRYPAHRMYRRKIKE